jgi:hypothetical protein
VGLMLTALLQSMDGLSVHLYEKRREYTRTRMVRLASYLVADSVASYRDDHIDGETVEAVFDPPELDESLAFRRSIPPDLMTLLQEWSQGFCPLNSIERAISDLIDTRGTSNIQRTAAVVTFDDAVAMLEPGDALIDCACVVLVASPEAAMLIPTVGAVDRRAGQFDETHSAFDQAPRDKALGSERAGMFVIRVQTIQLPCGVGFTLEVHQIGDSGLHAERQFVIGDGGFQLVAVALARQLVAIQFTHESELVFLQAPLGFQGLDIGHRICAGAKN